MFGEDLVLCTKAPLTGSISHTAFWLPFSRHAMVAAFCPNFQIALKTVSSEEKRAGSVSGSVTETVGSKPTREIVTLLPAINLIDCHLCPPWINEDFTVPALVTLKVSTRATLERPVENV